MLVELMSLIVYQLCINNKQLIALGLSHCHAVEQEHVVLMHRQR
jgi:hypothetical protein